MHRHAPGLASERDGLLALKVGVVRIDGTAKHAALVVVIEYGTLVRAENDLKRAIGEIDILQHEATSEDAVIGVGIEGPVLMPLDGGAAARSLGVELRGLQQHIRAEQLPQHLRDPRVPGNLPE